MNKEFVRLINEDGTIKVYKNNIISINLLYPSKECSYYDEQIYNIFDLINQIKEKDKEIEGLSNIINELEEWLKEKQALCGINQQYFSWGVAGDCLDKLKELKKK